ncbi:hypothetical protein Hypma_003785 [Hypsizygus marmoreus]|uniref:Uncharacterized protein n=1 Tax=Hypsizygus marmoreus TaxID=39966 RepID=A0A369JYU7_HYPMA|nr:hypothetical protein Hypma_003785 [Hypsizygus marmoreus]
MPTPELETPIATVQARIDTCAEEYRAAHVALTSLGCCWRRWDGSSSSYRSPMKIFERFQRVRLVIPTVNGYYRGYGERWGGRDDANDDTFRDALRVEWCKSRARAMRFAEEVALLSEEMDRVLRFFQWRQDWWKVKAEYWAGDVIGQSPRGEGLKALAECQAALQASLASHFIRLWLPIPSYVQAAHMRISESPGSGSLWTSLRAVGPELVPLPVSAEPPVPPVSVVA